MTTKEKILLYFRDINYAYNDCTRLDALEKGLSELEEVVRCKDCKHSKYAEPGMVYCPFAVGGWVKEAHFCADGERKEDPT